MTTAVSSQDDWRWHSHLVNSSLKSILGLQDASVEYRPGCTPRDETASFSTMEASMLTLLLT